MANGGIVSSMQPIGNVWDYVCHGELRSSMKT
jgi:hypothetical protein